MKCEMKMRNLIFVIKTTAENECTGNAQCKGKMPNQSVTNADCDRYAMFSHFI